MRKKLPSRFFLVKLITQTSPPPQPTSAAGSLAFFQLPAELEHGQHQLQDEPTKVRSERHRAPRSKGPIFG